MKEWMQEEHREQKMYAGADGDAVPEEFREARSNGLYYLQFAGKTENEMRKKLAEQGFSPASVEDAVLFLKHYRYLDDEDTTTPSNAIKSSSISKFSSKVFPFLKVTFRLCTPMN